MDDELVERVLRAVEQIPMGCVVSYGDIAALVGTGPRQVGSVMSQYGSGVTWWRVTNAHGDFRPDLLARALPEWHSESIVVKPNGRGCRIDNYRPDMTAWAAAYDEVVADLP